MYSQEVPVELRAQPREGYRFVRWKKDGTAKWSAENIELKLAEELTVTAVLESEI